jgi:hypothetical protein
MATPDDTQVVLDVMVGGLTSILRMVGYDTIYALEQDAETDDAVMELAREGDRVLVTRDRAIAATDDPCVLLTATDTEEQLRELHAAGFELELDEPRRCSRCNGDLERVSEGPAPADGPDPSAEPVWRCVDCGQHFWKGSHWADVAQRLATL